MNSVNLTGRIGKDPEVHTFDNGNKQSSFSLAVDDGYFKEKEWIEKTVWLNIVKRGETKLKKGDLIEVSGKINVRDYEKDGNKVYITEIMAFNTKLLSRKNEQDYSEGNNKEFKTDGNEAVIEDGKHDEDDSLPF